ncbi:hypothetical protein RvY_15062 [Ramazzottius varieornatus]|uniref:DNA polymerase delta subunit 4 n=1 Tax=Ramazzottius varieornatus TaxID=947166 RepID=A0A1D1W1S4_RAMVA|nr:hypothetical protein RvY_15062 [Ramazzottius varieornatus]
MPPKTASKKRTSSTDVLGVRKRTKTVDKKGSTSSIQQKLTSPKKASPSTSSSELRVKKSDSASSVPKEARPAVDPHKPDHLKLLKRFDMDYTFGPCAGQSRIERWERAQRLGRNPPAEVMQLIQTHLHDDDYVQGLWHTEYI